MKQWWRIPKPDVEGMARARMQRREAERLAQRLARHREENHFGEKFHAALRLKESRP